MDNLISTIVFLLPGFLMYFWIQSFGINSVSKHGTTEIAAISALLWIPVTLVSLSVYNFIGYIFNASPIWSLMGIENKTKNILFISEFSLLSVVISFVLSIVYVKIIYRFQRGIINWIREKRGIAPFSEEPSVWDEVFGKNTVQSVKISKIDKQSEFIIGELEKVPRPFESEKCFYLRQVDLITRLVEDYSVPIEKIFLDTKSGMCIKIYDQKALKAAYEKDSEAGES